jgi:hypothetical protein
VLVASLLAVVVGLVVAWWWLARDASGPTRTAGASNDESARVHGSVELAASPASSAARTEAPEQTASDVAAPEPASPSVVSPPHLLVTRAKEPLVGARVELWNAPRDGPAESFVFTSDADGRVPLPPGLEERGPWFALAGGDGACSNRLCPVRVDVLAATTELRCADAHVVAVVFERSDGRPSGSWEGHFIHPQLVRNEWVSQSVLSKPFVTPEQTRCLVAAGLAESSALAPWEVCVLTWNRNLASSCETVAGTFREPDTEEVKWSVASLPLASGGALARVAVPVLADFAEGLVEVRFAGGDATQALELADAVSVNLRQASAAADVAQLELFVRWNDVPMARAQTLFRAPVGRYEAYLRLGSAHLAERASVVADFDVVRGETTTIEFVLPATAVLVFDEAARAALLGDDGEFTALLCDVDTGVGRVIDVTLGGRLEALVPAGRWVFRVQEPVCGLLVPAGRARELPDSSPAHLHACRAMDSHYRREVAMALPPLVRDLFIDARAGAAIEVEFVPDARHEETR